MTTTILSRRVLLQNATVAASAACLLPRNLLAQAAAPDMVAAARAAAASAKVTLTPLRRNVSVLIGSGGNIGVLASKNGKLLVDSGFSTSQPQVLEALASVNADPIRVLVNTHWHFDHTDGNEWVHKAGASIWALENTRYRMVAPQRIEAFNYTFPAAPNDALPTTLFTAFRTIGDGTNTVKLTQYDPAHTDTDLSVYFAEADVFHAGDTWFNGFYPFIDYSTGGSIDGMIKATKVNLAATTDATIIIPGHGPVGTHAQLQDFYDMLTASREAVAKLKAKGMPVEQAIAAKPTAPFDAKWGTGSRKPDDFVKLVYQGV